MKKLILLFLVILVINSCKKQYVIENLNGNRISAFGGHGGMGTTNIYPMNSFESISKCLSLGMEGSEIDVQMTKDSVLVAFHDEKLENKTNLKGLVNSLTWDELKNAHYTKTAYLNYSIITIDQLFSNIENPQQYRFTFDCKFYASVDYNEFKTTFMNAIIKILKKYQMENRVFIEATDEEFLKTLKQKKPQYKLFIYPTSFEAGLETAVNLGLFGITISTNDVTKKQIKTAHQNHVTVTLWDLHTRAENIEGIQKNPDFIQTDNVRVLKKLLN